jgi:hypothetical protein
VIGFFSDALYSLQGKSLRAQAAGRNEECTWINHALVTVIVGGGIGGALGWVFSIPYLGFRLGLLVALLCYLYREVHQWRGRTDKPDRWWWDATLDVLFPLWVCSPVLLGEPAFYVLTLAVAALHFLLRPIE